MARFAHRFVLPDAPLHRPRRPTTRREMLLQCANGFGALAAAALWQERTYGATLQEGPDALRAALDPLAPRPPPLRARAKQVLFLYMDGGPSQVDTFDWKPRLAKEHGRPIELAKGFKYLTPSNR